MSSPRRVREVQVELARLKGFQPSKKQLIATAALLDRIELILCALIVGHRRKPLRVDLLDLANALEQLAPNLSFLEEAAARIRKEEAKDAKSLPPCLRDILARKAEEAEAALKEEEREEKAKEACEQPSNWHLTVIDRPLRRRRRKGRQQARGVNLEQKREDEGESSG